MYSVSSELLKNQISLHGVDVRQVIAALPRLGQLQSSARDKKAKRIALAARFQPKRENAIRLERCSAAAAAAIQGAVMEKSPLSAGKDCISYQSPRY
jgi:hypothetical protein